MAGQGMSWRSAVPAGNKIMISINSGSRVRKAEDNISSGSGVLVVVVGRGSGKKKGLMGQGLI